MCSNAYCSSRHYPCSNRWEDTCVQPGLDEEGGCGRCAPLSPLLDLASIPSKLQGSLPGDELSLRIQSLSPRHAGHTGGTYLPAWCSPVTNLSLGCSYPSISAWLSPWVPLLPVFSLPFPKLGAPVPQFPAYTYIQTMPLLPKCLSMQSPCHTSGWLPPTRPSLTQTAAEPPTYSLQDLPTPCWQGLASSKVTVFLHCLKQPGTTHGLKTEVTHAHESKTQSSFSVPFSATTRHLPSCHPIS